MGKAREKLREGVGQGGRERKSCGKRQTDADVYLGKHRQILTQSLNQENSIRCSRH